MKAQPNHLVGCGRRGFTLVEMLVVITIIALMLAIGGSMLRSPDGGDATRMAVRDLRGMMELAQMRAIASGNQTAVLIHKYWDTAATATNERFLRFAVVVEQVPTAASTSTNPVYEWRPMGTGSYFPNGAYYWPLANKSFSQDFAATGNLVLGAASVFGGGANNNAKNRWYGLLFSPQGVPTAATPLVDNPVFLISPGTTSQSGLDVNDREKLMSEGFMLQKSNGRVIPIENPKDQLSL